MARKLPAPFHYATATDVRRDPDGTVSVRYHRTDVATLHPDGTVTLRSDGWQTVTTKRRINQAFEFFGISASVYQVKHSWYVARHGTDGVPFVDGMRVRFDAGAVQHVDEVRRRAIA